MADAAQTAVAESHGSVHALQVEPMAGREATLSATSVIHHRVNRW